MKTADGKSVGIGERGECHKLCAAPMQGGTRELECSDFKYKGECGDAATTLNKTSWYPQEQGQWKR